MLSNSLESSFHIVMYKPEIPQNVGAAMRLTACLSSTLHIIEPLGFFMAKDRLFPNSEERRVFLDYKDKCDLFIHKSIDRFLQYMDIHSVKYNKFRIIAFTPHSDITMYDIAPKSGDILIFGRESDGLDEKLHRLANILVKIPMAHNCRSFSVSSTIAMAAARWKNCS